MLILALEYNILKNYVSKHNLHIYKEYKFNLKNVDLCCFTLKCLGPIRLNCIFKLKKVN